MDGMTFLHADQRGADRRHDRHPAVRKVGLLGIDERDTARLPGLIVPIGHRRAHRDDGGADGRTRSEEHTSELQSLMRTSYAVFCLKKKIASSSHILTRKEQNYRFTAEKDIQPRQSHNDK